MNNPTLTYAIFHLNLAFSSIDEEKHSVVIEKCYWPLLKLIEQYDIPLALELTAYTLEKIEACSPAWILKFSELLELNKCELVASGDSQVIGPLVPTKLNAKNLELGQRYYQQKLGITPRLAYINEQATSAGLLDVYIDAGFEAVVIEWDNPYSHNPSLTRSLLNKPQTLLAASGREIKVIWNHAVVFQKFQRYAHDEIILKDYLTYLNKMVTAEVSSFPLYGSDAEIFDYRPGRYSTESTPVSGEFERIKSLFLAIKQNQHYQLCRPIETLTLWQAPTPIRIENASHPITVKKQSKYNITRWGLSGRDDIKLNTLCHKRFKELEKRTHVTDTEWKSLCRWWASDLRTHLTDKRYQEIKTPPLPSIPEEFECLQDINRLEGHSIELDAPRKKLKISTETIQVTFNINKGMSIDSLAFLTHQFKPVCGTLSHGHFDHISYSADFYSNHLVMERTKERDRVTDLVPISYRFTKDAGCLILECKLNTQHGQLLKWYKFKNNELECGFKFENQQRPEASLRLGFITLLDCSSRPWFACHNGGDTLEIFHCESDFDHGSSASTIVSANSGLGATKGETYFGSNLNGVYLKWDQAKCAPMPMLSSKKIDNVFFNRLWFSLIEIDETLKPNGCLPAFTYQISPITFSQLG